ncbi:MAG: Imm52 family immunity protein [Methylocella sp.]
MSAAPILITQITSPAYYIHASWGPRTETPEAIAARFLVCVDRLKQVHPAYDDWISDDVNGRSKKLNALRSDLPAVIAAKVARADDGDPTPIYGYRASAINSMKRGPRSLAFRVNAGAWVTLGYFCNSAQIGTGYQVVPDPSVIAYPAFKAALLALVESFDATYCSAYPVKILNFADKTRHLCLAWMSYVAPRFAPLITPPPAAIYERTAQGGLLLSATEETFRVDNPAHLAAAQGILKALAPFEALPWPPDATPE